MDSLDPKKVQEHIERVLAKKEYTVYYQNHQTFLSNLWNELKAWLQSVLEKFFPNLNITSTTTNGVLWFFSGLLGLVVIYFLIKMFLGFRIEAKYKRRRVGTKKDLDLTIQKHFDEADLAEQRGELNQAVRHTFLALILYLDEEKWLEARPWKTNLEYIEELGKQMDSDTNRFGELAIFFDEAVYGSHLVLNAEYQLYREQVYSWIEQLQSYVSLEDKEELNP